MKLYQLKDGLVVLAQVIGQYCGTEVYKPVITGSRPYVMAYILRHNLTVMEE